MIKRTPQEIADFTGCYVAQDFDGSWMAYETKPTMNKYKKHWTLKDGVGAMLIIHRNMLDIPEDHHWTKLYEPHPDNKSGAYYQKTPESDNKKDPIDVFMDIQSRRNITRESEDINAESGENRQKPDLCPHQSEVFIHQEYVLLGEFQSNILMEKVNELLKDGFKLYGNPWTGPDVEDYGYIHYQAMVRGV